MAENVVHRVEKKIYIHNDLQNAAEHFRYVIADKLKAGDPRDIAYDCMACLTMLALAFEAQLNFIGNRKITGWNERLAFAAKLKSIKKACSLAPDMNSRPWSTIAKLKSLRDMLAHGKPVETAFVEEVENRSEALTKIDLDGAWVKLSTPEATDEAYVDIEAIWAQLLAGARIPEFEAMTQGSGSFALEGGKASWELRNQRRPREGI